MTELRLCSPCWFNGIRLLFDNIMITFVFFQALVNSLEKKIDENEKKYEELSNVSEERLQQALAAESKIIELKTAMQRSYIQTLLVLSMYILYLLDYLKYRYKDNN